jgi:hypothetical protein
MTIPLALACVFTSSPSTQRESGGYQVTLLGSPA